MLSRKNRLTTSLFEEIRKSGKRFKTPYFSMIYRKGDESQFAVVVSKKKLQSAVERNQQRRKMYAVLKECLDYPLQAIIFMDEKSFLLSEEELKEKVIEALKHVEIKGDL